MYTPKNHKLLAGKHEIFYVHPQIDVQTKYQLL